MLRKLTISILLESLKPLKELSDKDLSVNVGAVLANNIKELNKILEVFVGNKQKLFSKYGENVNGNITIIEENVEVFNKEYNVLINQEIEAGINAISVEELRGVNLKTSTLLSLDWLIKL